MALIIIVDDNDDLMDCLRWQLEDAGHHVVAANNGANAETLLKCGLFPDLVISDYQMPGMNGVEFFRRSKWRGKSILWSSNIVLINSALVPKHVEIMEKDLIRVNEIVEEILSND